MATWIKPWVRNVTQKLWTRLAPGYARPHCAELEPILERLAKGPEPLVRNAVAKAMRRSRQRYTEEVEETRLRWLKDRDRSSTAELVGPLKKRP